MIWFTSDPHFGHDREFIWRARGFTSCEEMNETIVERWNECVAEDDIVYILGDIMLGSPSNISYPQRLKGKLHIILGNHDTNSRIDLYRDCKNIYDYLWADRIKINGYHFYLSHFPTITANIEKESLKQCTINLFGHTHQKTKFFMDYPFMYHVGMDAHDCRPIPIDQIIHDMEEKFRECKQFL